MDARNIDRLQKMYGIDLSVLPRTTASLVKPLIFFIIILSFSYFLNKSKNQIYFVWSRTLQSVQLL